MALSQGTVPKDCPNGTRLQDVTAGWLPDVLSHGTVPSSVPTGHARNDGASGTLGTGWTPGTLGTNDTIEERAGLAVDRVPALYLDAWARLNHQKPFAVSDAEWRLALDDGGLFLDARGNDAAELGWTPGDLFDVTAGLIWRLAGERVETIRRDRVTLSDGRMVMRRPCAGSFRTDERT